MKFFFILTLCQISNFAFSQSNKSYQEKFFELETEWMTAWKNKDEATVRRLIADDFTLTSTLSTGELVNKETWIDKALHQYDCKEFKIDKLNSRVYGKTAVLNIWFQQIATANGKDWSGNFLITDIWVLNGKQWQVVSRHASWLPKGQ